MPQRSLGLSFVRALIIASTVVLIAGGAFVRLFERDSGVWPWLAHVSATRAFSISAPGPLVEAPVLRVQPEGHLQIDPVDCATAGADWIGYEVSKGQLAIDVIDFLDALLARGHNVGTVDISAGPIPDCVRVLVVHASSMNLALAAPYMPAEASMLKAWVAAGHSLMLSGEWGTFKTETQALFQAFGYTQIGGAVRDPDDFDPNGPSSDPRIWVIYQRDNFGSHPILQGIDTLQLQASSSLDLASNAIVIADANANPSSAPVMAAFRDGLGCVAMTTDSNWYATNEGDGAFFKHDNASVAYRMVEWLNGCASLSLTKSAAPNPVPAGQTLTYTLTVNNGSATALTDLLVTDRVPGGTSFLTATLPHIGPAASGVISWSFDLLGLGTSAAMTMVVRTDDQLLEGTVISNMATVTSAQGLSDTATNLVRIGTAPPTHSPTPTPTPTPEPPSIGRAVFLPLVYAADTQFPLFIGDTIPLRPVAYQGEVFYTTTVRIPARLPDGGHFFLSSEPDRVSPTVVDDALTIYLDGTVRFTHVYGSPTQRPMPAIVEIARETMVALAAETVTVEYSDVYTVSVGASAVWLVWTP